MIAASELILNPDGSVYHLQLKPGDIANKIIFVGDQDRVEKITKHFDHIEFTRQKREFKTQTGSYKGKRITVISTGIGPDNIDIVLNELDALVNVDFETRQPKAELTSLQIVRVGTSGSLQADIPVDSWVASAYGLGLDNMMRSYCLDAVTDVAIEEAFIQQTQWDLRKGRPYVVAGSAALLSHFKGPLLFEGFTGTAGGFYGPQGRVVRLAIQDPALNAKMDAFSYQGIRMTNLEMETAAIYGLGALLGHQCLSLNAIIANRALGTFSENPYHSINGLIAYALDRIALID